MSGKYFTTLPNGYLEPRLGLTGYEAVTPQTVIEVFQETVTKHGDQPAMCYKPQINVYHLEF